MVPEVKFNLGLLLTEFRRAEVNSKLRLNITQGTIIFYHSLNKRAVSNFVYNTLFIDFWSVPTVKSGK